MRMRFAVHVVGIAEVRNEYRILAVKPEGNGKSGRRREDNIKMDLTGTGYAGVDSVHAALDKVQWRDFMKTVMNLWAT
jgi:hypothetical protein